MLDACATGLIYITTALVIIKLILYTKFLMSSFTHSKDMIGAPKFRQCVTWSCLIHSSRQFFHLKSNILTQLIQLPVCKIWGCRSKIHCKVSPKSSNTAIVVEIRVLETVMWLNASGSQRTISRCLQAVHQSINLFETHYIHTYIYYHSTLYS